MAVECSHHQGEGFGGCEPERRKPGAVAEAVTAVGPTNGLHRNAGFAKDPDVAPGGPLRDAEFVGKSVGGDARTVLDQFEGEQRPRRGALVRFHGVPSKFPTSPSNS